MAILACVCVPSDYDDSPPGRVLSLHARYEWLSLTSPSFTLTCTLAHTHTAATDRPPAPSSALRPPLRSAGAVLFLLVPDQT
jgi:hypothetical protein